MKIVSFARMCSLLHRWKFRVFVFLAVVVVPLFLYYNSPDRIELPYRREFTKDFTARHIYYIKPETFQFGDRPKVAYTDCVSLLNHNTSVFTKTKQLIKAMSMRSIGPSDYMNMTETCDHFTQTRHYIMDTLSKEEKEFPIAYSILMYRDVEQFERLLRAIYRPQNVYCVHVDLNSKDDLFKAVESIVRCFPNVFMSPKRITVKWGKFSVLEPELICMDLLLKKNKLWKYFINLTGQEFPLKTNNELVKILSAYNGSNDIAATRKRKFYPRWKNAGTPPHKITVTKGAVHIIASRGYVAYILTNQKAQDILAWVKKTILPDETFFSTLNHNPHLKVPGSYIGVPETGKLKPFLGRFKNWRGHACDGYYLRDICIFGIGDLSEIAKSKKLFANKFIWNYLPSRVTFECIEELVYNRTKEYYYYGTTNLNITWYATRGFVKNQINI